MNLLANTTNDQSAEARLINTSAPTMQLMGILAGIGIYVFLWFGSEHAWLHYWLAAHLVVNAVRYFWMEKLVEGDERVHQPVPIQLFHFSTFIAGCIWGMLIFFLQPDQAPVVQFSILLFLCVISVGAMFIHAPHPFNYSLFIVPLLLPVVLWCVVDASTGFEWVAGLLASFGALLMYLCSRFSHIFITDQRLRKLNSQLVSELERSNEELEQQMQQRQVSETELHRDRRLFRQGPVVMYRCVAGGNWLIEWVSDNIRQFGYDSGKMVQSGIEFAALIHPSDLGQVEKVMLDMEANRTDVRVDFRLKQADDSYCWVSNYSMPVFDFRQKLQHLDGYLLDMSSMYAINEALDKERERAMVTLQSIGDAVVTTNTNGRIDFLNKVAEELTGWSHTEARYQPLADVFKVHSEVLGQWLDDPIHNFFSESGNHESRQLQGELYSLDGRIAVINYNVSPIRDLSDKVIGYVIVFHDVTEKRALQEELEYQARHDALTGLMNRREFENRLLALLTTAHQQDEEHVLMYIDLDQFKLVNDTCGHSAGDELLKQLAQLLRETLRGSDVLARLGGDEFGILLPGCSIEKGEEIADNLRTTSKEFRFIWGEKSFDVGTSIGLVPVTKHSEGVQSLLSAADIACYAAKDLGRNRIHTYLESDKDLHRRRAEMDWASRISDALKHQRFELYYQDIVPVRRNEVHGARHIEVLLRMRDPNGNHILPGAFLPAAERYSLMPEIDRWVVKSAFDWYESEGYSTELVMAINLSGLTINSTSTLAYIKSLFDEHTVPASSICFEITETAAISNLASAAGFMRELRQLGCRFALDDFGSGLSSFAYLKTLPVDFLKIDGNFVLDMLEDKVDRAMISAINDVGHTMSLQTIAEYVESNEVRDELARLDVDFVQGHIIAKPRLLQNLSREETFEMIIGARSERPGARKSPELIG